MKGHPLIKVTLLYVSGIILQRFIPLSITFLFISSLALIVCTTILLIIGEKAKTISNICIVLSIILAAGLTYQLSYSRLNPYPFSTAIMRNVTISGEITNIELKRKKEFRLTLKVDSVTVKNKVIRTGFVLLCKIRDLRESRLDSVYNKLGPGNYISLKGTLSKAREMRNPWEFDYQNYLVQRGYSGVFSCPQAAYCKIKDSNEDFIPNLIFSVRKSIDKKNYAIHSKECSALLRGLILADRGEISDDVENDFVNTGVVHILAVSGSNVLLIILIFSFLFGRVQLYNKTLLTITGLFIFLVITGITPSVLRAVIMASVVLFAYITNRSSNLYNAVSLSALIILLAEPLQLFDPGFQLSYSAVLSIMLINSRIMKFLENNTLFNRNKLLRTSLIFVLVTLSAQIGTLPFTLFYFSKFSLIAVAANLLIIPLIAIITGSGIFAILLSMIWGWGSKIFATADNTLTQIVYSAVHYLGNLKFSFLFIRDFTLSDTIVFYFFILVFFAFSKRFSGIRNKIIFSIMIIACMLVIIKLDNRPLLPDGKLSIMAIDVGQGDATLIKFPDNKTALIDAGETNQYFDNGGKVILPLLMHLGIDSIDYGFVSHIDSDHYSGFIPLIEKGIVKRIYKPLPDSLYKKDINFENYLKDLKVPIYYYKRELISIGNSRIYILTDDKLHKTGKWSMNDKGGIIKIVYGKNSFFFAGDAGVKAERTMVKGFGKLLSSDLLKLGHHGSKGSSSMDFLKMVSPEYALISAGIQNRFNHPSPQVLHRLDSLNIKILRTDIKGAIIFISDGENIKNADWERNHRM